MSVANLINTPAGGLNQGCWKRKRSEEDKDNESSSKKGRYSWYVTLESESPQPTSSDEDDESIHSVQAQETEYVQDTSDTSTNTWVTSSDSGDVVHLEYEVASLSEDENPFIDGLSSSDPEDIIRVGMIAAAIYDSDVDLADDSDDSRSSRDSEISHADYWTCVQCNANNNNPLFRYCEKCYRLRKNFFPPRPKGRKRRSKLSKKKAGQAQASESQELTTTDSGLGFSQGSQPSLTYEFKQMDMEQISNTPRSNEHQTSLSMSQEFAATTEIGFSASQTSISDISVSQPSTSLMSQQSSQEQLSFECKNDENRLEKSIENNELDNYSQESVRSNATTLSINSKDSNQSDNSQDSDGMKNQLTTIKSPLPIDPENNLCRTCVVGEKDGIFVHGQTAHICCCYRCAKRIWKTTKHCPMCNRKLTNVLKANYG